jgi:hypothetical protein
MLSLGRLAALTAGMAMSSVSVLQSRGFQMGARWVHGYRDGGHGAERTRKRFRYHPNPTGGRKRGGRNGKRIRPGCSCPTCLEAALT